MYYGHSFISFHSFIGSFILALLLFLSKMVHGPHGVGTRPTSLPPLACSTKKELALDLPTLTLYMAALTFVLALALAFVLALALAPASCS